MMKAGAVGGGIQLSIARRGPEIDASQVEGKLVIDERPRLGTSMLAYAPRATNLRIHTMFVPAAQFALIREAKTIALSSAGLR